MSVALVSLFPLETMGGGELYTVETAQAVAAAGDRVWLAAPVDVPPLRSDLATRLRTPFLWCDASGDGDPVAIEWGELLARLCHHDDVWAHQYLASDFVFDLVAAVASDQRLLFTSLGYEPLRPLFADLYQPNPAHHFVEISRYAADRARPYARTAGWAHAAIWRRELTPLDVTSRDARSYLALGRVLPHKGLETTIDAVSPDEVLHIVGQAPDEAYAAFLRQRAHGKQVRFHGVLPRAEVQHLLRDTTGLVSASTHRLFDGRRIEQPELLGLVLCEALRDGTLPVSSDVPAFLEVMDAVGLADWTFQEGDASALRERLERLGRMADDRRAERLEQARAKLVAGFCWDDYWPRVRAGLEEPARCA